MSLRLLETSVVVLALVGGIAALPSAVSAQTTSEYRARVERLDSLHKEQVAARRQDASLARNKIVIDTVRFGQVIFLVRHQYAGIVRTAAQMAWRRMSYAPQSDTDLFRGMVMFDLLPLDRASRGDYIDRWLQVSNDTNGVIGSIESGVSHVLKSRLDESSRLWFEGRMTLSRPDTASWRNAYIELATSPFSNVVSCYAGDLGACRLSMGLIGGSEPVTRWYDSSDRRILVSRYRGWVDAGRRCKELGNDSDCQEALRTAELRSPSTLFPAPPLSMSSRRMLVSMALELGGTGAYERLLTADSASTERRLVAASGVAWDSLLHDWRAAVFAARPKPTTISRTLGWTAFGWIVVLGALATRSSRWR